MGETWCANVQEKVKIQRPHARFHPLFHMWMCSIKFGNGGLYLVGRFKVRRRGAATRAICATRTSHPRSRGNVFTSPTSDALHHPISPHITPYHPISPHVASSSPLHITPSTLRFIAPSPQHLFVTPPIPVVLISIHMSLISLTFSSPKRTSDPSCVCEWET